MENKERGTAPVIKQNIMGITHRTNKADLCQIMVDVGAVRTVKEANAAYEAMTTAMNAWLRAMTRTMPKTIRHKLTLRNAFTINLAWVSAGHKHRPDFPALWIATNGEIRANMRRHRLKAYSEWAEAEHIPKPT
jgi:hypothetical protein